MNINSLKSIVFVGSAIVATSMPLAAQASVTVYTTQASYTSATTTTNLATFEGLHYGTIADPLVQDGIRFHSLPGGHPTHDLYITPAFGLTNITQVASSTLSANGDENFDIRLASAATFGAIGFDVISNAYRPRIVSLYGVGGSLIGTFTAVQPANSVGYFGVISTTPIAYIQTFVDRGYIQDTAIDNVRIGPVVTGAVPEPATWALMLAGFGLVGVALRRRQAVRVSFV